MFELLRGAFRFRGFIIASVKREFTSRYLGTQLGFLWQIFHPLALITIYTLVFAGVMSSRLPGHDSAFAYSIYLTSGFIAWSLFSDVLMRSVGIFVQNAALLKKVSVHKLAFPAIATISASLQAGILLACFLVFLVLSRNFPGLPLVAIVPVLAIGCLFAMGLGLFLATVNVFYRDVEQGVSITLQFWFWVTPIVYPIGALPPAMQSMLVWNPMWPIVRAMQVIFVDQRFPDWASLTWPLAVAVVLALLARAAYGRLGNELVDEL